MTLIDASLQPKDLRLAQCETWVVCGAPGAGKSTWAAAEFAGDDDLIIDLDECFKSVCGVHGHHADRAYLPAALICRNSLLWSLASKATGRAALIVSAPTAAERQWWSATLGAQVKLIDPGMDAIAQRDISEKRKTLAALWSLSASIN